MADEKKEKVNALSVFRGKLRNKEAVTETLREGLSSTNAKVRQLAAKLAYKTQKHDFVKKHVLPLLKSEKTKRVLGTISKNITRKELGKKLAALAKAKPAAKAEKAAEGGGDAKA